MSAFRRRLLPLLAMLLAVVPVAAPAEDNASARSYQALIEVLEDDAARASLVQELRRLSADEEQHQDYGLFLPLEEVDVSDAPADIDASQVSLSRRIAARTQNIAERLAGEFSEAMTAARAVGATREVAWGTVAAAAVDLGAVVIAVLAAFFLLRGAATGFYRRVDRWAGDIADLAAPLLRKTGAVAVAATMDLLIVFAAWILGYAVALFALGESGSVDARQSMFLNAFLLVEVFKALMRVVFATRFEHLRLVPMLEETAAYWAAWFARLAGFIGYGLLLVVPIINFNVSPAAGSAVTLIIMIVALVYALAIILQNRDDVRTRLRAMAQRTQLTFGRVLLLMLSRSWHLIAIGYFLALVIVAVLNPEAALPFMLGATAQTVIAIAAGIFVAVVLAQIISRRIRLAEDTRTRFPLLEERLNSAIPGLLQVVRAVILFVVLLVVLDAWAVFNLPEWLRSEAGTAVTLTLITVGLILVLAKSLWIGVASWIEHRLNPEAGKGEPTARERTLLGIFRGAFMIVLVTITVMFVLSEIGINIAPLIAGAGVLGLAIGFGAQKLVQDVITGIFIQLENAIDVGDVITAGGITGTAERLTIRSVGIRDLSGTYHVVPFSSVDAVSNFMRDFAYHVGVYGIAYREDIDEAIVQLRAAFDELVSDAETAAKILAPLEVHGVTELGDSSVNIRVRIKTSPGNQWAVGRAYNRLVKRHFDAAGIEIPFPHLTMYFGEDKQGDAPPANVRLLQAGRALPAPASGGRSKDKGDASTNPSHKGDFDDGD